MELFPTITPSETTNFLTNPFRLFDQTLNRMWPTIPTTTGQPFALDLVELPEKYLVKANLPGVDKKCVDISFENNLLTVHIEIEREDEKKEAKYLVRERFYQSAARSIPVPLADQKAAIDAVMKDGVLKIVIPKSHEKVTKRIEIH